MINEGMRLEEIIIRHNNKLERIRNELTSLLKVIENRESIWYHYQVFIRNLFGGNRNFIEELRKFRDEFNKVKEEGDKLIFEEICKFRGKRKYVWIDEAYGFETVYASKPFNYNGKKFNPKSKGTLRGEGVLLLLKEVTKLDCQMRTYKVDRKSNVIANITIFRWN